MITSIRGKEAEWPREVWDLWESLADGRPDGKVWRANYYTPRPYVDEYNRGSTAHGFTYIILGKDVYDARLD